MIWTLVTTYHRWAQVCARYRPLMAGLASLLFAAGALFSIRELGVHWNAIRIAPLVVLAIFVAPSSGIYGAAGLLILARSVRIRMPLAQSFRAAIYATVAEMLPLPGGMIVRTGALFRGGATLIMSSSLVLFTGLLWLGISMASAGFALLLSGHHLADPLLLSGIGISVPILAWLWRNASAAIAFWTAIHRLAGLMLMAARLQLAFAVLGATISLNETLPFVFASVLGSAVAIAPAGLGISESLAALLAVTSSHAPGTAFLAVGLDRLLCFFGSSLIALSLQRTTNSGTVPGNGSEKNRPSSAYRASSGRSAKRP